MSINNTLVARRVFKKWEMGINVFKFFQKSPEYKSCGTPLELLSWRNQQFNSGLILLLKNKMFSKHQLRNTKVFSYGSQDFCEKL